MSVTSTAAVRRSGRQAYRVRPRQNTLPMRMLLAKNWSFVFRRATPVALAVALLLAAPAIPTAKASKAAPSLDRLLVGLLPEPSSSYGLALEDLATGAKTGANEATAFPSASLYKLGVAWVAMRRVDAGQLGLDDPMLIEEEDAVEAEPDGGVAVGDSPSVREALEAMLSLSSNNAAHAFLRVLGRPAISQEMARLGLTQTRLPEDDTPATSGADVAQLLRLIATSPQLSDASRETILNALTNVAGPDALKDTLPASVDIIEKTGNIIEADAPFEGHLRRGTTRVTVTTDAAGSGGV